MRAARTGLDTQCGLFHVHHLYQRKYPLMIARFKALLCASLIAIPLLSACTPEQATMIAEQKFGIQLTPAQAREVAAYHSRPQGNLVTVTAPQMPPGNWAALRRCESGGNYKAVSRSGKYRGAYQFDRRTWAAYGPPGDPAAASPAEQDRRAAALYRARGWRPWPHCGKKL